MTLVALGLKRTDQWNFCQLRSSLIKLFKHMNHCKG